MTTTDPIEFTPERARAMYELFAKMVAHLGGWYRQLKRQPPILCFQCPTWEQMNDDALREKNRTLTYDLRREYGLESGMYELNILIYEVGCYLFFSRKQVSRCDLLFGGLEKLVEFLSTRNEAISLQLRADVVALQKAFQ